MDVKRLAVKGSCKAGLYFCLIKDICEYLDYGTKLAVVKVADNEDVYVDRGKFRTHRLEIQKMMPLSGTAAWKYLYENGADITVCDNYAVRWAASWGCLEVLKYLHKNGADITASSNEPVCWASLNGHLETVKYLCENGADITAYNNSAVRWASENGHLDIVKYLYGNGADIAACHSMGVCLTAKTAIWRQ